MQDKRSVSGRDRGTKTCQSGTRLKLWEETKGEGENSRRPDRDARQGGQGLYNRPKLGNPPRLWPASHDAQSAARTDPRRTSRLTTDLLTPKKDGTRRGKLKNVIGGRGEVEGE